MSMNAIRQLNSGGLKLKSNFSARAVAANITANRGAAVSMVKGGYSTFGSNALFTPARRMGGAPRYMSASQLSRTLNGQNMRFMSGGIPSYSGVSYSQNYNVGTSSAFNTGMGIGATLNLAMQLAGGLKELGVFNSKTPAETPQGAGQTLATQMQSAFGQVQQGTVGGLGSAGIQTASSFGSNFDASFNSIESYMKSDTMDPKGLRDSASNLVSTAYNDVNNAEANFNILKARQSDAMSNQSKLQSDLTACEKDKSAAKTEVGTRQGILKSAKQNRTEKDNVLTEKSAVYKTACSDLTAKEGIKDQKQTAVSTCTQDVTTAKTALTQATANKDTAQAQYDSIPNDAEHAAQKAAAQAALTSAKEAEAQAQLKLQEAEGKLDTAKQELDQANKDVDTARTAKNTALDNLEKSDASLKEAVKNCKDAEAQVSRAQSQFDTAQNTYDMCNTTYTEAKAAMDDASGVIAQCQEYETQMKTLKDNLVKATKLQDKANKTADNYEKKHSKTETPSSTSQQTAAQEMDQHIARFEKMDEQTLSGLDVSKMSKNELYALQSHIVGGSFVQGDTPIGQLLDKVNARLEQLES